MVRPQASEACKMLSLHVANSITAPSQYLVSTDSIGRSGSSVFITMFDVLARVCPSATRVHNNRNGVSVTEFNKILERNGYSRVRMRICRASKEPSAPEGASCTCYRFAGRRWLDPDDAQDLDQLAKVWVHFCAHSPLSLWDVSQVLREAIAKDAALLAKPSRRLAARAAKQRASSTSSACSDADTDY
eukprot:400662-Rhodomonas_salina.1